MQPLSRARLRAMKALAKVAVRLSRQGCLAALPALQTLARSAMRRASAAEEQLRRLMLDGSQLRPLELDGGFVGAPQELHQLLRIPQVIGSNIARPLVRLDCFLNAIVASQALSASGEK